jgi:phosphoserine phosphatase
VPKSRVIAVDPGVRPIPCGEGKVLHLKAKGIRPALAVGNGELDLPMLAWAAKAVVVAPRGGPDNRLVEAALARSWPVLRV